MTLEAKRVAFLDPLEAVHVMTVAASHIPVVHLALGEGAVSIDFVQDLAVREIELFGQQGGEQAVQPDPLPRGCNRPARAPR